LFVEDGVTEFGGLQGDHEYIPFRRDDLAPSLVKAMDYVLAVTSVPLRRRVEGNKVLFEITGPSGEQGVEELQKAKVKNPRNLTIRSDLV